MNEMVITCLNNSSLHKKRNILFGVTKICDLYTTFQEHIYCIKQRGAHLGPCLCVFASMSLSPWSLAF